jgi:transposase
VSPTLQLRQDHLPRQIVDLAWRALIRLNHRYRQLAGRIGVHKTLTAVGRELAGFVWTLGQVLEEVAPAAE